ncbi:class I SAM-dependent methyltransferase [Paenibacillus sp. N1-5-1-14]|uniref:class I SAM-dependent methyltransferase n=1 Tax=Paenibacillus radicibacter TaxID=2972488 RepID=UPI002158F153|nr:class I SAM-dependent methyltransferase [Paenibacillus radicibacter]MCR8643133.1 class I SAM-dependent methyltransferase [Paenibacillus radicibacter]
MNEEKFSGKAEDYMRYRPSYPEELLDYLYSEVGFNQAHSVADIGAGTGIWSKLLASRNSSVICVEPNVDMLNMAKENLAHEPTCSFVKAPAEHTTLADHSVDYITVAQAFHWFEPALFKLECKRILKDNGKVVLVWNSRDYTDQVTIECAEMNQRFCPEFKGFSGGIGDNPDVFDAFFSNGDYEFKVFNYDLTLDEESFIGRSLSASYAPHKTSSNYDEYVSELKNLFQRNSVNGLMVMRNKTRCYVGKV